MKNPDISAALAPVIKAFEEIGIQYYLGGSIASSAFGIARTTLDADIIADLKPHQVKSLVARLGLSYYIDEQMILDAIKTKSSFNIIHLNTMFKIDVFLLKNDAYAKSAFQRRKKDTLDVESGALELYLASPEDIFLHKLYWFKIGGKVSERQWGDVLGILKVQADSLDNGYLRYWADEMGIADLLDKATHEATTE
jgi:hypothetical protein